ncbi:MAG: hypothetical protein WD048_13710 [Chitinophagales bacterium]
MKILKGILIFALAMCAFAVQAGEKDSVKVGKITYHYPAKLDTLIKNFIINNKQKAVFSGYRIQLIAGTNRQAILNFKSDFYKAFPEKRSTMIYQQPNFKLREGAYRSKIDAYRELILIQREFPDAFIIQDDIPLEDL